MKKNIFRLLMSAGLYYVFDVFTSFLFIMPDVSLVGFSSFLPPILGLMWGPIAAVGSVLGAILVEYEDFFSLPEIWRMNGAIPAFWEGLLLFLNCGFWAFVAAYLPCRLWHSLFVDPNKPIFAATTDTTVKFVKIMFITTLTTSLFLSLTTKESDMLRLIDGLEIAIGTSGEYALTCFLNDFDITIFFGMATFFFLTSLHYPFYRPKSVKTVNPRYRRAFDGVFVFAIIVSIILNQQSMIVHDGFRVFTALLLCVYMFRPFAPPPKDTTRHEKILRQDDLTISRKIAAVFYILLVVLFLWLDGSGTIYGLEDMDVWRQFNAEVLTMMALATTALIFMLLRYHHSIMTNIVMLEIMTIFFASFALGTICFVITDRITSHNLEESLENASIICRERMERTFDNIQLSVNDIHDLALAGLTNYDSLTKDSVWRENYLRQTEKLFLAIASNTGGSVAFYFRLSPEFAGAQGGFSFGREKLNWDEPTTRFYRRNPIDLSKYDADDFENVGWYYIPVLRKNSTWIEPYIDPIVQTYVISYVSPVFVDNKLVGVAGMDIDIDYIIHEIERLDVGREGYAYLTDRHGRVLYHKDFRQGEFFKSNPEYREKETYLTNGLWIGIATPLQEIYTERNNLLMHIVCVMILITLSASTFSIALASKGIRPLLVLTEAAQKIAAGNLNVKLPDESKNELGTLVKSIREMVAKLEIYVYRDRLTGLSNTTAYGIKCEEISNIPEDALKYAVIVFDLNFLKRINDTYGHEAGNELICCAAGIISKTFSGSGVFRIGGDEFVAILDGTDYELRDELLVEFDRAVAAKHFVIGEEDISLSVARGVGVWKRGMTYAEVFQIADDAMYAHKTEIKKKLGGSVR